MLVAVLAVIVRFHFHASKHQEKFLVCETNDVADLILTHFNFSYTQYFLMFNSPEGCRCTE